MRKRILVVDDDQMMRLVLQELLEDEAYEVDTAFDGVDALAQLDYQRNVHDVILLDLTMPHLNGLQFLHKIQQQDSTLLRSIIALSADEESLQQAACIGIYNTLEKPFDPDVLLELVERAMRSN
ncbi:response regulator [Ktedonobacter robiniae]|uniref:Two-component system response regulator n=1 Tax=Ktedonobacter robiniae TaxID=2778365 RepID=A0ABQ3UZV5_9CHLR|nr:response regulator [Ktedonobacter robiniae]GHO57882.1 two-component system response regulator [Ktedonobacter robiniae]